MSKMTLYRYLAFNFERHPSADNPELHSPNADFLTMITSYFSWTAMFLTIMQVGIVKCDPYHLHGMYGTFHSANFPQFYDNNQIRNWTIRSPVGFRVVLYFTEFDLEDSYYDGVVCAADYIEVLKLRNMHFPAVYDRTRTCVMLAVTHKGV